jgi:hypothetical protein
MTYRLTLPNREKYTTQKVRIADHDDARPAEIFLRLKGPDCSSGLIGLYDVIARLMRLALQYGASARKAGQSPRWSQICPMWPCRQARSHYTLYELAGSHRLAPVG